MLSHTHQPRVFPLWSSGHALLLVVAHAEAMEVQEEVLTPARGRRGPQCGVCGLPPGTDPRLVQHFGDCTSKKACGCYKFTWAHKKWNLPLFPLGTEALASDDLVELIRDCG